MSARKAPALLIVVGIFVASAGLRIAAEGQAWADQLSGVVSPAHASLNDEPQNLPQGDAFLEALQRREVELDQRAARMDARAREISAAEAALRAQIIDLERAEQELNDTLALASGAAEADVARLVSVYESMRPATAAPLFSAMDPTFAAGFLMRMQPDAAGAILAEVTPDQAYALSAVMAGRHSAVVRE